MYEPPKKRKSKQRDISYGNLARPFETREPLCALRRDPFFEPRSACNGRPYFRTISPLIALRVCVCVCGWGRGRFWYFGDGWKIGVFWVGSWEVAIFLFAFWVVVELISWLGFCMVWKFLFLEGCDWFFIIFV